MVMMIPLRELVPTGVLAGRLPGNALRPLLEDQVVAAENGAIAILDFTRVDLVTASYFLAAFEWLWEREVCPVIANTTPEVREEIELALKAANLKALFGTNQDGHLVEVQPFNLDSTETATYEKIRSLGTATANDLYTLDRQIQPSAWSNRLALLYRYRLLRRQSMGRQLAYSVCGS